MIVNRNNNIVETIVANTEETFLFFFLTACIYFSIIIIINKQLDAIVRLISQQNSVVGVRQRYLKNL